MPSTSLTIERVLTLLRDVPTRIAVLTTDLSPEALQRRPTPDEWSANEVLAHLRACADVWGNYNHEDHRRGPADMAGGQSPHLDQADGLS